MRYLKLGLVGKNILYSLSPQIHSRIFELTNTRGEYSLIDTDAIEEKSIFSEFNGLNITIPYKEEFLKFLQRRDKSVEKTGSVNTVSIEDIIAGYNTDYLAFSDLLNMKGMEIKNALIIGAGGAARAAIAALIDNGCQDINVINRSKERTFRIKLFFKINDTLQDKYSIVVNTVPPEGKEFVNTLINKIEFSYFADFVYSKDSPLTERAMKKGIEGISGYEILILQALYAQEIWQGRDLKHIYGRLVMDYARK